MSRYADAAAYYSNYARLKPLQPLDRRVFHSFKAQGIGRIMQRWVYNAEGDAKTCEQCQELDGWVVNVEDVSEFEDLFPYGEAEGTDLYRPNTHPNCRCTLILIEVY